MEESSELLEDILTGTDVEVHYGTPAWDGWGGRVTCSRQMSLNFYSGWLILVSSSS